MREEKRGFLSAVFAPFLKFRFHVHIYTYNIINSKYRDNNITAYQTDRRIS